MKKCLLKYNFFHSFGSVLHFDQIIFIVIKENKKFVQLLGPGTTATDF